ncbi:MAG TPA: TAT-variant-translocated molybdopterin oxidoreductase [Sphingomicrobium sp.]|nr:TAT-variant-translocated molybdopterin oxidoreductase [Sphingomicrobium sp.]
MTGGKKFWRSLEEFQRSDAFGEMLKAEFPSLFELWTVDRREVLRVMGASLALAGVAGCKPTRSDDVVPFVNRPEGYLEGRTDHYATAIVFEGYAQPVLATTSAGRPIKLDGNPDHPAFRGGSSPFMQAAILDLYDPDRSQAPLFGGHPASWADFDGQMAGWRSTWRQNQGAGLRLLIGPTASPTLLRQIGELRTALPQVRVHLFDPLAGYAGEPQQAIRPRLDAAEVVVSLDDDLLGPGPMQAINARAWGDHHGDLDVSRRMRLLMAETTPTQTGAKADRRLGIPPSRLPMLARAIVGGGEVTLTEAELAWAKDARQALQNARGRSLLTVGRYVPPQLQALALEVNQSLGNVGQTCELAAPLGLVPGPGESFIDLIRDIEARRVSALIVIGANPVYQAPGDVPFGAIYAKIPLRIHAGLHVDETAAISNWHLPLNHALEDWSDARSPDGLATIVQPVVRPMYDTRSAHEILAALTSDEQAQAQQLVRQSWPQLATGGTWAGTLKTGFLRVSAAVASTTAQTTPPPRAPVPMPKGDEVEIVIRPDPTIHDGSFANNGWLQELPKPLFKTTWENVVSISPRLAAELKVDSGDMLRVESRGRSVEGPAWILPGQPEHVVTLYLGYGRKRGGRIGTGIGYDAYRMRSAAQPWNTVGTVKPTGAKTKLATTQDQHLMDGEVEGLVRTVSPGHPSALRDAEELDRASFYPEWPQDKPAWGMVIDLDRCIGCNACVIACQAENNVPVVGKKQVYEGREMAWLRVDRYYAGEPDDPETHFEPVPCMHCEQAPCEMDCPVHATVHSPEGLNLMVYNRCIGTRTCSSYCPYKVRRFNWFDYTTDAPRPTEAQRNPDVTVRGRGVMEKCTYCIQRIEGATVRADIENRAVRGDEVTTACQQACPAQAISFGNLADANSTVAKQRKSPRNYSLLAEQGTRPRTTYLARIGEKADGE